MKLTHSHEEGARQVRFTESKLAGCYVLQFPVFHDERGSFVKTIQQSIFADLGLEADFKECFYTSSNAEVLRGMHFQLPPKDHAKLVYCTEGAVYDMALDLRAGSPTFGKHEVYELSSEVSNAVYLPRGIAHGFYVRRAPAVMVYHVTSEHDAAYDTGILWDSFGAVWPSSTPIVSPRDRGFMRLAEFKTPFA